MVLSLIFTLNKICITDHFNMYVNFIHLIQKISDERFPKNPKGHGRKSEKIYLIVIWRQVLQHLVIDNLTERKWKYMCYCKQINALIIMGNDERYHKLKHLQTNTVWTDYVRKHTGPHKYKYPKIIIAVKAIRNLGYMVQRIKVNDIYMHVFS